MAEPFHVDVAHLNAYLGQEVPHGSLPVPRQLLQTAYNALLTVGAISHDDRPIRAASIAITGTTVTLNYDGQTLRWFTDALPALVQPIAGLADHLAALINQPASPGPWPKQLD
jgi:hypothetical protein